MAFARIVTHYFTNGLWLEEGETLTNTHRLAGIPGVMIHGRLDLGAPLMTAWEMHRAWPGSELVIVGGAGHDTRDPGMAESIVAALDRFARRA
jgi:proline iminopeptidase